MLKKPKITLKIIIFINIYTYIFYLVKLEIDTTDERNQTNSNALDTRPKNNVQNADGSDHMRVDTEEIREELKYTLLETNSCHRLGPYTFVVIASVLLLFVNRL